MKVLHPKAPYPKDQLTWRERFAIRVGILFNYPGLLRTISVWWGNAFTCRVLTWVTQHRWRHHQPEALDLIETSRPVLLVSNHRTFFDMYVGATALRNMTDRRLGKYLVFPVRSPFFYDRILGVLINLFFSGNCMWPPVFRDERKDKLNPVSIGMMKRLLSQERICFGFHPEGRRSKNPDPYQLEPPKRGVGGLIQDAPDELCILPLFISGLSGDVKKEWSLRKRRDVSDCTIEFYWGTPKSARDYQGDTLEIAQAVHADIQALADQARALSETHADSLNRVEERT